MSINLPGFTVATGNVPRRITVCSQGRPRTGKTGFALRTLPDPVGVITHDRNFRSVAEITSRELGRKIYYREFIRGAVQITTQDNLAAHAKWWDDIQKAYYDVIRSKDIRSVVIDTGTEMWDYNRLGNHGTLGVDKDRVASREFGAPNRDMSDMMEACDKNMIVTHTATDEWKNNAPTGRDKCEGWKMMPYKCNVQIEHYRTPEGVFGIRILNSTANRDYHDGIPKSQMVTLEGDECTFQMLAFLVYPDATTPEDWY